VIDRRAVLLSGLAALVAHRGDAGQVVVEDWRGVPVGTHGIPPGWRAYATIGGHPVYDFTVIEEETRRALRLRSVSEHSTVARDVAVTLAETPILEWSWKVTKLPAGADLRRRETSDSTGHIFLVWPRFPALVRSRVVGYVWDEHLPSGAIERSRKTGLVTFIVVRSGTADLGRWVADRRNVAEDYERVFGEPPVAPGALALSIDTNDTRAPAEATFGGIRFRSAG
jgi:hypothetical protein